MPLVLFCSLLCPGASSPCRPWGPPFVARTRRVLRPWDQTQSALMANASRQTRHPAPVPVQAGLRARPLLPGSATSRRVRWVAHALEVPATRAQSVNRFLNAAFRAAHHHHHHHHHHHLLLLLLLLLLLPALHPLVCPRHPAVRGPPAQRHHRRHHPASPHQRAFSPASAWVASPITGALGRLRM